MNKETMIAEKYAAQLLQDRSSISSSEFPLENDNDYWLSFLLTVTYDEEASPYVLHLGNGQVKRGRYSIPIVFKSIVCVARPVDTKGTSSILVRNRELRTTVQRSTDGIDCKDYEPNETRISKQMLSSQ